MTAATLDRAQHQTAYNLGRHAADAMRPIADLQATLAWVERAAAERPGFGDYYAGMRDRLAAQQAA